MKKLIIVIAVFAVIFLCSATGFSFLGKYIYAQRGCEEFSTDNFELHAHIDIKNSSDCGCDYDPKTKVKKGYYQFDKNMVDFAAYPGYMRLTRLKPEQRFSFAELMDRPADTLDRSNLYVREESGNGENWKILYDKKIGKLWITGKYAN